MAITLTPNCMHACMHTYIPSNGENVFFLTTFENARLRETQWSPSNVHLSFFHNLQKFKQGRVETDEEDLGTMGKKSHRKSFCFTELQI